MKVRKRVIAASIHVVVAISYLILWIAKWCVTPQYIALPTTTSEWQSPSRDIINEVLLLSRLNLNCQISIYDDIFHDVCGTLGTDWRLMSAIGYVESRFKPYVISHNGAMGIMQIMPRTATIHGVSHEMALTPRENIRIASLHYNLIDFMMEYPETTSREDRMAINLACYNGGIGRIRDAQRLARHVEEDPYSWSVVRSQLIKLADHEFQELECVKMGRFPSAKHTVGYVHKVMHHYRRYCKTTERCPHHLYPIIGHHF